MERSDIISETIAEINKSIQSDMILTEQKLWLEDYKTYLRVLIKLETKRDHLLFLEKSTLKLLKQLGNESEFKINENIVKRLFIEIILKLFNTSIREFRNIYESALTNTENNLIGSCLVSCIKQKVQNIKENSSIKDPLFILLNNILIQLDFKQNLFLQSLGETYRKRESDGVNLLIREIFYEPSQFLFTKKCNKWISDMIEKLGEFDVEPCQIEVIENNTKVYDIKEFGVDKVNSRWDKFITVGNSKNADIILGNGESSVLSCILFNEYNHYHIRYTSKKDKFEAFAELEPGKAVKFKKEIRFRVLDIEILIKVERKIVIEFNYNMQAHAKTLDIPKNGEFIELKSRELFNLSQDVNFGLGFFDNQYFIVGLKGILLLRYSNFYNEEDIGPTKRFKLFPVEICEATIMRGRVTNLSYNPDSITAHFSSRRLEFINKKKN